jgi:non-homologous end joining protein Ku
MSYERGQFVTFSPAELKALGVESSHAIDLMSFVSRADVDPIYSTRPITSTRTERSLPRPTG